MTIMIGGAYLRSAKPVMNKLFKPYIKEARRTYVAPLNFDAVVTFKKFADFGGASFDF